MKKYMKLFQVMTFHTKLKRVQNHCVLGSKKIDGFIRVRGDEFKHLVLFDYKLFDKICDKIKYLVSEKSGIADSINLNFGEIRIDSDVLPIERNIDFL